MEQYTLVGWEYSILRKKKSKDLYYLASRLKMY